MSDRINEYGQPIGPELSDWRGAMQPMGVTLHGRYARLELANVPIHAEALYAAYATAPDGREWTYLTEGPFESLENYRAHLDKALSGRDPLHYAVVAAETGLAQGTLALMRIDAANGVVEIGHVTYSPLLQRSRAGTEAVYLLLRHAFDDLGYRRVEWKCDALNVRSQAAARRYGFQFEGVFRQARVYRQRSRDTTWFSIIDSEWPAIRERFERWLEPSNFDAAGLQKRKLQDC